MMSVSAATPPLAQPSYRRVWSGDYNRDSGKSKGRGVGTSAFAGADHRRSCRLHPVAAPILGVVQSLVSSVQERGRSRAMVRKSRDPQRNGDGGESVFLVFQLQLLHRSAYILRALSRDLHGCLRQEHREFFSADAARDVALAHKSLQQKTHAPQNYVARAMAQRVIDAFEVIDVHRDDGEGVFLAIRAPERYRVPRR